MTAHDPSFQQLEPAEVPGGGYHWTGRRKIAGLAAGVIVVGIVAFILYYFSGEPTFTPKADHDLNPSPMQFQRMDKPESAAAPDRAPQTLIPEKSVYETARSAVAAQAKPAQPGNKSGGLKELGDAWDAPIFASGTVSNAGSTTAGTALTSAGVAPQRAVQRADLQQIPGPGEIDDPRRSGVGGGGGRGGGGVDDYASSLTRSNLGDEAEATVLKDGIYRINEGRVIPCTLLTAVNSQLPGGIACQIQQDIPCEHMLISCLDRFTIVAGQIRSGVRRGQDRLFVLWEKATTPHDVRIKLTSPGTDALGRAGIDGEVNNHFWRKFWAVTLFEAIQAGPQIASAALQNHSGNGNSYNLNGLYSPTQSLAGTILQEEINIPPALEKNQGDVVGIYIARDLLFKKAYGLSVIR